MLKYKRLFPLFLIQFFTWLGLFSLWIYGTPVVTKEFFATNGHLDFEKGAKWTGIYFALYAVLGASLTFVLHKILKQNPKYIVHSICLFLGGTGLMSMYFINSRYLLLLSFVMIGIAWSSISTTPYLLVGEMAPEEDSENFYSVFNFSTVIPQVIAAFFLAFLTKEVFGGTMLKTIFAGGVFMWIAAAISLIIFLLEKKQIQ